VNPALHIPVMLEQAVTALRVKPGGIYVDLTVGAGGHTRCILDRSAPDGRVLGLDRDPEALQVATDNLMSYRSRVSLFQSLFSELPDVLQKMGLRRVDGMVADLGVSSLQFERAERGFSLKRPGPLDMRMDPTRGKTLDQLLAEITPEDLASALRRLGQVERPRHIARRILEAHKAGKLNTTVDLARVGSEGGRFRLHPATRVFLALRMLVNNEAGELDALLAALPEPLECGGRAAFITFHSVEDRRIKQRFAQLQGRCTCVPDLPVCTCGETARMHIVTRRPQRPTIEEVAANPRARSARLRVAERVALSESERESVL
jgi:16S rRNA (cytosine1402-N4)-methyltransferase